ncbi:uncharacterized protein METZ01_LOCUS158931, partial [marine metagenome]
VHHRPDVDHPRAVPTHRGDRTFADMQAPLAFAVEGKKNRALDHHLLVERQASDLDDAEVVVVARSGRSAHHPITGFSPTEADEEALVLLRRHRFEKATDPDEPDDGRVRTTQHRCSQCCGVEQFVRPHERVVDSQHIHERKVTEGELAPLAPREVHPHDLGTWRHVGDRYPSPGHVPGSRPGNGRLDEHREGIVGARRQRNDDKIRPGQRRCPVRPVAAQHDHDRTTCRPHGGDRIDRILFRAGQRTSHPIQVDAPDRLSRTSHDPVWVMVHDEARRTGLPSAKDHPSDDVDLVLERHLPGCRHRTSHIGPGTRIDHETYRHAPT